jgi:hypothetical protein
VNARWVRNALIAPTSFLRRRPSRRTAAADLDPEVGEYRAVPVAGALALIERERFCDGYVVLTGT